MLRLGWPEVVLILLVLILVFGVGRITKIGGELGSGLKAFKDGLSGNNDEKKEDPEHDQPSERDEH